MFISGCAVLVLLLLYVPLGSYRKEGCVIVACTTMHTREWVHAHAGRGSGHVVVRASLSGKFHSQQADMPLHVQQLPIVVPPQAWPEPTAGEDLPSH